MWITAVAGTIFFYIAEVGVNRDVHNFGMPRVYFTNNGNGWRGNNFTHHLKQNNQHDLDDRRYSLSWNVHNINSLMAYKKNLKE